MPFTQTRVRGATVVHHFCVIAALSDHWLGREGDEATRRRSDLQTASKQAAVWMREVTGRGHEVIGSHSVAVWRGWWPHPEDKAWAVGDGWSVRFGAFGGGSRREEIEVVKMQSAIPWRVQAGDAQVTEGLPGESDIGIARLALRVHCPIDWPEGLRCNNCQAPFPCAVRTWGHGVLAHAGWADTQIAALDKRTGPWA